MRQPVSEYEEHDDGFGLMGEQRAPDDYAPPRDRRLPALLLSVLVMAVFAGGLWFAYVQGTRHNAPTGVKGEAIPVLRADQQPTKVKPDQPGGMTIPDQNVSIYNEKPGGGTRLEKLLPPPEKPLPRPTPPPVEAPSSTIAGAPPPPPVAAPSAADSAGAPAPAQGGAPAIVAPTGSKPAAQGKTPAAANPAAAVPAPTAASLPGRIQVRLGSLRSPEAAKEEWTRLKHEHADLLGNLSAVAVRTDLGEKGIYYRIEAGPFADTAAAEKLCGEMKRRNLGCILAR